MYINQGSHTGASSQQEELDELVNLPKHNL
jgi:hypothetical protein